MECISKRNSSKLKQLLISFVKAAKERFIKHFGYDENNFVEDNFSLKLRFIIDLKCEQIPLMD